MPVWRMKNKQDFTVFAMALHMLICLTIGLIAVILALWYS